LTGTGDRACRARARRSLRARSLPFPSVAVRPRPPLGLWYPVRAMEPQTPVGEIGERALIRHLRSRIPSDPGVIVGVGDDAAAVETGTLTLVTTDVLVEGIHFRRDWSPPRLLGRKALSVNLSDIAAMAGLARFATVSLCLPPDVPLAFVDG